jgi:hypothetical protein
MNLYVRRNSCKIEEAAMLRSGPWSDFRLIYGGGSFPISSSVLLASSPVISRQIQSDKANLTFTLPPVSSDLSALSDLFSYLHDREVRASRSNFALLYAAATSLDLPTLLEACVRFFSTENPSEWAVDTILDLHDNGLPIEPLAPSIFAHFDDYFAMVKFHQFDGELISAVLGVGEVELKYPFAVAEFLVNRLDRDHGNFSKALAAVANKHLNPEILSLLVNCSSFDLRLIKAPPVSFISASGRPNPERITETTLPFGSGPGVFAHLRSRGALDYVEVRASSVFSNEYCPEKVLDFASDGYFSSARGPFDWIEFMLIEHDVVVSGYSLRAPAGGLGPSGWQLDGSVDGAHWHAMHEVIGDEKLRTEGAVACKVAGVWRPFRFLRIIQIQPGKPNNPRFALAGVEFFGVLRRHQT